ncbi:MAG TPA: metallophosphoesterase [Anaerolineales bacterium]|nr:metallophosphoesterase [Anaerolineales bacterium]
MRPIRILAVSDSVQRRLEAGDLRERLGPIDLLVGCGDLPPSYLEYLLTHLNIPAACVPGNHDPDEYAVPGAWVVDGRWARAAGLTLTGFGGSRRYKSDGRHQYTEAEMTARVAMALPRLLLRRLRKGHGVDIVITHAPPFGVHDASDLPHVGFRSLGWLVRTARPRVLLHGHTHRDPNLDPAESTLHGARVINVNPYRLVEIERGE